MDSACRQLAAEQIRVQVEQLARQLDGLRAAEDIEFVHHARVATRRLRTALRMFKPCFGRKQVRRWRKAMRRMTAALGEARDRDVQIAWVGQILPRLRVKKHLPGVARVAAHLERDRRRLQRRIVKAADRLESRGILREILSATPGKRAASSFSAKTVTRIQRHVSRRVGKLLRFADSLNDVADYRRHHAMRIAAKRLRYTMEIACLVQPGRYDKVLEAMKRVQTLLGDMHDCDVWLSYLDGFVRKEQNRLTAAFGHARHFAPLEPGIEHVRADRTAKRRKTFEELAGYWPEARRRLEAVC
jgi:CHAD domain-containing protein